MPTSDPQVLHFDHLVLIWTFCVVHLYIRVAAGDYNELLNKRGKDNALTAILGSITHELTHYYQRINGIKLTAVGEERQAKAYVDYILDEYSQTREHP